MPARIKGCAYVVDYLVNEELLERLIAVVLVEISEA
jgi:hypothetical protein